MTKHKVDETKVEREFRKTAEHNERMLKEYYHYDIDKARKKHVKELGEYLRGITAKFSDKEMEEAITIGEFIALREEPEEGLSYKEIAMGLWPENEEFNDNNDDAD